MSAVFGKVLTLVGGAMFGTAAWLALSSGTGDLPLLATGGALGLGVYLIYR